MQELENGMVVDAIWEEIDYGVSNKRRLKRERKAYQEVEGMDGENERCTRVDYAGSGEY